MNDSWHAAAVEAKSSEGELLSHLLYNAGCNGVVEESLPDASRVRLTAYFNADGCPPEKLIARIREALSPFCSLADASVSVTTLASNEWKENWRQWFRPFEIVPGIFVSPSWESFAPESGSLLITLDPGMAFGTGLHETTRLCAGAICDFVRGGRRACSVLDVGTGSGLLAIVAAKLGAGTVAAVENDPDALSVALENFEINGTPPAVAASSLGEVPGKFDLVVANILMLTLIGLKGDLLSRLSPGGRLVLSGITHDQETSIEDAFSPPLSLSETKRMGEWSCMVFDGHG